MELTICERWTQYVEPPTDKWFLDYVVRDPKHAGVHLTAGWHAYQLVRDAGVQINTAIEYFGGMGAQSMMIQELFGLDPHKHLVYEYSPEAVAHLEQQLGRGVQVIHADSYDPESHLLASLVGLDFGDLTVWKTREGEKHRALLDRVFAGRPRAVVLTDVAARYLHLHVERYETLLGEGSCASYTSYLDAFAARLEALYGYTLAGGFWDRWSTVMTFLPDGERGSFVPTPDSPLGLEVVA